MAAPLLNYRLRPETTAVVLHASHTPPSQSNLEEFLAVGGRERGLLSVGYHFLILQSGLVVTCRPFTVQGTHMRSKRNRDTIGVCLAGGIDQVAWDNAKLLEEMRGVYPGDPTGNMGRDADELRRTRADNFTPDQWSSLTLLMHTLPQALWPPPAAGPLGNRQAPPRALPPGGHGGGEGPMPSTVGTADPLRNNCAASVMASPEVVATLAALKEKDAPVAYKKLTPDRQHEVIVNGEMEAALLERLSVLDRSFSQTADGAGCSLLNARWHAIARTHFEQGFMALNRAITETQR